MHCFKPSEEEDGQHSLLDGDDTSYRRVGEGKDGAGAGGHEDVDIDPGFSVSLPSSAVRELV